MDWYEKYMKDDAGNFGASPGSDAFHMEGEQPNVIDSNRFSTPVNPSLATHIAEQEPATQELFEVPPIPYALRSHRKQPPLTPMPKDVTVEDVEEEEEEEEPVVKPDTKEMQHVTSLVAKYQPNVKKGNDKMLKKADADFKLLLKQLPSSVRSMEKIEYDDITNAYDTTTELVNAKRQHYIDIYREYFK
jgi:hypothetical protein